MSKGRWLRKMFVVVGLLGILVMQLVGCGTEFDVSVTETDETFRNDNLVVVGVSQIGSESMWRTANTNSIQNVFTISNGYQLIFDNARQKQENQIKAIRSFISQQVDYIVFSPITEDGWDTVLQEAKDANIPVILMDRMVNVKDESLYTSWVGSNFELEGENAGFWLEEELKKLNREREDIRIVVLKGTEGSTSVIGRTEGFQAVARRHPNWKIIEEMNADYTTAKAEEEMRALLRKDRNIDVVVSQNDDMTFGAIDAIEDAGLTVGEDGDVLIISFDAVKNALRLVQQGKIGVDIECNPRLGLSIEAVIHKLENKEPVERAYYTDEQIFTIDNVADYIDQRTY